MGSRPSHIQERVPLAGMTTMGVGGSADFFCVAKTQEEVRTAYAWARGEGHPITVLGGGSNVVIDDNGVRGLVIEMRIDGIEYRTEGDAVFVTCGAGVMLDTLIADTVVHGWWGLENLSSIPGTVGAMPIQNVGAYGVETKDVLVSVTVYDGVHDVIRTMTNEECAFGYRSSYFKTEEGASRTVLDVELRLSRIPAPRVSYKDISAYLGAHTNPTQQMIRDAVIAIRARKFPDWRTIGTAGSFFKNPIVSREVYEAIAMRYPDLPKYELETGDIKIPLGWILDHILGLRGKRVGKVGLYEAQALVLVAERGATAHEIFAFGEEVRSSVRAQIGIDIEYEVVHVR